MALDTTTARPRRAILAAALAGLGGYIASALGRPAAALATNGDTVTVGGSFAGTSPTAITNSTGDAIQAINTSAGASGLYGHASAATGTTYGVFGRSESTAGTGVAGVNYSASGLTAGVYGQADSAAGMGVSGHSASGWGVYGKSSSNVGVFGESTSNVGVAGRSSASNQAAIVGQSTGHGTGIIGSSSASVPPALSYTGVYGYTDGLQGVGVDGSSGSGTGVHGHSTTGTGVSGSSPSGIGVYGVSDSNIGVYGDSSKGTGVEGTSSSNIGVYGASSATAKPAILGSSNGSNTGVQGFSGTGGTEPAARAKTGVFGYAAQDASARGVTGESPAGIGVLGQSNGSGTGVRAYNTNAAGLALLVTGRAGFSRSGRASVPANASYVDVTVPGGLASSANVLATLQALRSGVYVAAVRINYPTTGKARIYLNKVASTSVTTPVAWFVLG